MQPEPSQTSLGTHELRATMAERSFSTFWVLQEGLQRECVWKAEIRGNGLFGGAFVLGGASESCSVLPMLPTACLRTPGKLSDKTSP